MDQKLARLLAAYQPTEQTSALIKSTPILVLVGPTGAGKDSVKEELLKTGDYHHIVSHTTRPPRINHGVVEKSGKDYHFIDKAEAERMLSSHELVEAKIYSTNLYGTSVAEIQKAHNDGKVAMTDIEVQGVAEYKALDPAVVAVFILPPDFETWLQRLENRYGDVVDVEDFRLRLQTALEEIEQLLNTNYYTAIINDDLDKAVKQVETIIEQRNQSNYDDSAARVIAKQLAQDIQAHLSKTD